VAQLLNMIGATSLLKVIEDDDLSLALADDATSAAASIKQPARLNPQVRFIVLSPLRKR